MRAPMHLLTRASLALLSAVVVTAACGSDGDARDAGVDAGPRDSGPMDSGPRDSGPVDTGPPPPVDAGTPTVVSVRASSAGHACALLSTGRVRCWGLNDNAQVGRTAASSSGACRVQSAGRPLDLGCERQAFEVPGIEDAVEIALGNGTTCAVRRDRSLWCWGSNEAGQLGQGQGSITPTATPTRVTLPAVRHVAMGAFHVCAALMDGTVRCWGSNKFSQTGVAARATTTRCDEGDGTLSPCTPSPHAIADLTGVSHVALGRNHSCALLTSGGVRCWGLNDSAQLGNGEVEDDANMHPTPVAAVGLTDAVELAAGGSHNCARRRDGRVMCWGWGGFGQLLGAATTTCTGRSGPFDCARAPAAVPESAGAHGIAAGRYHGCMILADHTVRCAGRGDNGQLGVAVTGRCAFSLDSVLCSRTLVTPPLEATEMVSVGDYHSCALTRAGQTRCWGWNAYGQLGDGTTQDRTSPVAVQNLP